MLGWQVRSPTAAIVGIGLGLGLMAAAVVPLVKAQTPTQAERARKAYEEHMRRMDDAEKKTPSAKPATPASPPTAAAPPPAAPKTAAPAAPTPAVSQADQDAATE